MPFGLKIHPGNRVYIKLTLEEINTILIWINYFQMRKNSEYDEEQRFETLLKVFLGLSIVNSITYVITTWYVGFYNGKFRKRIHGKMKDCKNCIRFPCFLASWFFYSVVAICTPFWGISIYWPLMFGKPRGTRRVYFENAERIFAHSRRIHAFEDLLVDLPLFLLVLYLQNEQEGGMGTFGGLQAFSSCVLFLWSFYTLLCRKVDKGWTMSKEDVKEKARAERERMRERLKELRDNARKREESRQKQKKGGPAFLLIGLLAAVLGGLSGSIYIIAGAIFLGTIGLIITCHAFVFFVSFNEEKWEYLDDPEFWASQRVKQEEQRLRELEEDRVVMDYRGHAKTDEERQKMFYTEAPVSPRLVEMQPYEGPVSVVPNSVEALTQPLSNPPPHSMSSEPVLVGSCAPVGSPVVVMMAPPSPQPYEEAPPSMVPMMQQAPSPVFVEMPQQ